jgi:aminoglycoside phosphotransferase (APT) family kinase protein
MDESAWRADRPLDAALVARILAAQFPELRPRSIELLGEGWDSEVYEVDGSWVVRFPKRAAVQVTLAREQALLPALAAQLPIAVPRFELFGEPSELFPYRFVGYRKLPGVPLQLCLGAQLSARGERAIAQQLGEFLTALHRFEGAERQAEIPSADLRYLDEPIRVVAERSAHLHAEDPELSACLERFMASRSTPPRPSDRLVLTHADLDVEHILIDLDAEQVTAVIDWADVSFAAACGEFEAFAGWRGRAFTSQVLAHYRGPATDADLEWMRQRAIHVALGNLSYGRMAARRPYVDAGLHFLRQTLPPAWG